MRVAICDDEERERSELCKMLKEYDRLGEIEISLFSSAAELYQATAQTTFSIVLLDIEMKAPNGYEIAQQLQKSADAPLIVFVTKSMEYTIRGYGVAFRYLVKPIRQEDLSHALDAAISEVREKHLFFHADGVSHVISIQDIYFFEVFLHNTTLHLADRSLSFRMPLKDILAQLPKRFFAMPHQSYIVNFQHIRSASTEEICMTNGARIPISRRKQTEFEARFLQYLGR